MGKGESMQKEMGDLSREMKSLRKNQKEKGEIKNTVTQRMI